MNTLSQEKFNRGGQRIQNEALAEKTGETNSLRDGKYCSAPESRANARAGTSKSIALLGAQQGNDARDDYRHVTRPSTCTIFSRRTLAGALEDDPSSAGRLLAM